jgi:broad specificity phosphatase PhoE
MTAVYVVRHPQTTWNVTERYQGRLEAPLSAEGQRQARLTIAAFAGQRIDAVYSSPLCRALELGRGLAEVVDAPLIVDHRLTEIAMGPWEGLHRSEISERFPQMFREWYRRPDLVRFPGGETLEEVRDRARAALSGIFSAHPGQNVCVTTHSAVVHALVAPAMGLELRYIHRLQLANTGISTLCGETVPGRVLSLNVTGHLHASPVASALAQQCAGMEPRRLAS